MKAAVHATHPIYLDADLSTLESVRCTAFRSSKMSQVVSRDVRRYFELLAAYRQTINGVFTVREMEIVAACIRWRAQSAALPLLLDRLPDLVRLTLQTTSLAAHIMPDDPAGSVIIRKIYDLNLVQRAALVDILEQGEEAPLTVEQYNSMLGKMAERTFLEKDEEK